MFEALAAFRAAEREIRGHETIDSDRIVLRGFSMGGAGAWHLGLMYPSFWCSVSPGAGFTTTYGRVKNRDGKLPDYVVKCLGIYDALDYAENVFDVPVVAYGGRSTRNARLLNRSRTRSRRWDCTRRFWSARKWATSMTPNR